MKKFLAIYGASAETLKMWNSMPQEEGEKAMEEWGVWQNANAAAIVDPGNPTGKNTRLSKDGAVEMPNEICGYTIIQAASKEDALKVLEGNPQSKHEGAYVEVMEIMEM